MENSETVHNARVGKSYPVEIGNLIKKTRISLVDILNIGRDLNALRILHCHLIDNGKKAEKYEQMLRCQLYYDFEYEYIDCFRIYISWLCDGVAPAEAIIKVVSASKLGRNSPTKYPIHQVSKSGINTPSQKKIERGGFGKSAKSKRVMESDSPFPRFEDIEITLQKAKDELSQSKKEFELEHSKLQIRFYLVTILIPAIFIIGIMVSIFFTNSNCIHVPIFPNKIKTHNNVAFVCFQSGKHSQCYYISKGIVLTEQEAERRVYKQFDSHFDDKANSVRPFQIDYNKIFY